MKDKPLLKELIWIVISLIVLQCILLAVRHVVFRYTTETMFSRSMVTMICMLVFAAVIVFVSLRKGVSLCVFPNKFTLLYIIATVVAVAFYVLTIFVFNSPTVEYLLMLFYGSIVTPVFEELHFRGEIWAKLNAHFKKEWQTYLVVTALFALWHIGYAVGLYLWSGGNLLNAIVMKVAVGAVFGLITGVLRWKTKNCYCGILVHGILNAIAL